MSSHPTFDADREYRLIEQLELRVASANTESKFETVIQKFLAALILKVGSESVRNRNLAIKVCQHINQRLKLDSGISLPVQPLLKTFRETQNAFVSRFALIFLEQGLSRLSHSQRFEILPDVLRGSIPENGTSDASTSKMWSVAFDFLLDVLRTWHVPERATKEEAELQTVFQLSDDQCQVLSDSINNFISFDLKTETSWRPLPIDLKPVFEKYAKARSQIIVPIARFLFTSIFSDKHRFVSAVLLSIDANDSAAGIADVMFKQCNFDLEQETSVDILFDLFNLDRPKLQTKILALLSRSQVSTNRASKILEIVEKQLFRDATGLEAAKLRAAVFQYLTWSVRVSKNLFGVKDRLQVSLREFIELQGWPVMSQASAADVDLRAKAYESIGLLAAIKATGSESSKISLDLITWLFTSLRCDTTKDVRASVDEALSRILNAVNISSVEDIDKLKALLLWNVKAQEGDQDPTYYLRSVNSTRYLAVRFANKVLPYDDVDARYVNIIALGSNDRREVLEEGSRGLDPYWHITSTKLSTSTGQTPTLSFPSFTAFVTRLFNESSVLELSKLQIESLATAVVFGRNLLIYEALHSSPLDVEPSSNWQQKLGALVGNDKLARETIRQYMATVGSPSLIKLFENAIHGMSTGSSSCAEVAFELISMSSNQNLLRLNSNVLADTKKAASNNNTQALATRIFGVLGSLSPKPRAVYNEVMSGCSKWSTAVGQDAITARASLLCAGFLLTRMFLRASSGASTDMVEELSNVVSKIVLESHDKALKHSAYTLIGQMCLCMPDLRMFDTALVKMLDNLIVDAKKEDEVAVTALGRVIGGLYSQQSNKLGSEQLERLYALHEVRKAELHFTVGEALATAALGFRSESTLTEFDVDAPKPEQGFQPELFGQILDRAVSDSKATKPSLKKASSIWLLSLIQYCSDIALLKTRLRDCQAAFARLLNDRDDIVQETGSRGLGLVYEKGDKSLRDDLVRDLVQSFTGGGTKFSGTVDEDTELFEAGTLPTESGQSVQTYKDIVSLATEMGDPSLVYRFMNLASNNAIWTSRAAFGRFGLSGVLADSTYLTENKKFYPKLFRYRFDPNPNVQRSMDEIWKALVKDQNKVIEENFDLIITDLLKSIVSGKEWRAREASCTAISELVQGREVEIFETYLDQIWTVAFKVLDDVKETVRVAAMKLCRTLTGMLIRNLEVGEGTTKRATTMMQHAIPFLLQQMEGGSAQEVQQYAVVTLLEVVKKSPSKSLRPFAPKILEKLVLSLSSLEHESINYLHLNADKYGLTAEKLDKMRVSSINASPVSEAIERCLDSLFTVVAQTSTNVHMRNGGDTTDDADDTISPTADAMQRIETAFKTAIGLPSKVGLSRVMITLVVRHHTMFRPYADRFVRLTRKYILDRNATISISFSMALGYLVRLASPKEVSETSRYAQQLYFQSVELAHRTVAGEIIHAISKASNDTFMNYAATFLPFAFIGRNDLDQEVRNRFDAPWKDNVGGSRSLNLYLSEIVGLISEHIKSSLWPIKQACCLAVAELVSSMDGMEHYTETEARLLWHVMEEALNGKTWQGKEKVVLAFPKYVKKARAIWGEKGKPIRMIALREANRTNISYRPHALTALGEVTLACPDLELEQEVLTVLTNVVEMLLEEQETAMDVDDGGGEGGASRARHADATFTAVVVCLFQILTQNSLDKVLDQAIKLVGQLHGKISAQIDMEIYDGARRYITQATQARGGPSSSKASADVGGGQVRVPPAGARQAENPVSQDEQEQEQRTAAFLRGLVLAVLDADDCARRHPSDHETVRRSRVALAMALADSRMLNQPSRNALIPTIKACLQGERSRPLQMELEKALSLLQT